MLIAQNLKTRTPLKLPDDWLVLQAAHDSASKNLGRSPEKPSLCRPLGQADISLV